MDCSEQMSGTHISYTPFAPWAGRRPRTSAGYLSKNEFWKTFKANHGLEPFPELRLPDETATRDGQIESPYFSVTGR